MIASNQIFSEGKVELSNIYSKGDICSKNYILSRRKSRITYRKFLLSFSMINLEFQKRLSKNHNIINFTLCFIEKVGNKDLKPSFRLQNDNDKNKEPEENNNDET